jgi:hypothetical protein
MNVLPAVAARDPDDVAGQQAHDPPGRRPSGGGRGRRLRGGRPGGARGGGCRRSQQPGGGAHGDYP